MIASERRVTTPPGPAGATKGLKSKHPGVNQILSTGRAVKIYVIDPRKFQERLEKYVGDLKNTDDNKKDFNGSKNTIEEGKIVVDLTGGDDDVIIENELHPNKQTSVKLKFTNDSTGAGNNSRLPNAASTPTLPTLAPAPPPSSNILEVALNQILGTIGNGTFQTTSEKLGETQVVRQKKQLKKKTKKKKKVPSKVQASNAEDKNEAAELAYLMKETTTRTGRVSKSSTAAVINGMVSSNTLVISQPASPAGSLFSSSGPNSGVPSPSPSVSSVNSQGQRVKKREPPEMFRCLTCNKFYLGHTKLNNHFAKFPTHQKSDGTAVKKKKIVETVTTNNPSDVAVGTHDQFLNNSSGFTLEAVNVTNCTNNSIDDNNQVLNLIESQVSTASHNSVQIQTDSPISNILVTCNPNQNLRSKESANEVQTNCHQELIRTNFSSITTNSNVSRTLDPDVLSDNCSSPKISDYNISSSSITGNLPARIYNNSSEMRPTFLHSGTSEMLPPQEEIQPLDSPELDILPTSTLEEPSDGQREDYFMDFQRNFNPHLTEISQIPNELLGQGSCSQQSFNSLESLLADSNSQTARLSPQTLGGGSEDANGPRILNSNSSSSSSTNRCNRSTFFSLTERQTLVQNSSSSSYINQNNSSIVQIDEESRDICISNLDGGNGTENSMDGCEISVQASPSTQNNIQNSSVNKRRSIWEFVKEQIRLCGINQACGEISEMAEKLSKVARDKFYPIREDEIERMNGSAPIIHVDTPFISHLLDLPFGTYIFKEDGGIRKVIPPPTSVSADLSLTNGVEVDIDKFLSPDIDLISLPHLTNLDFASICNE